MTSDATDTAAAEPPTVLAVDSASAAAHDAGTAKTRARLGVLPLRLLQLLPGVATVIVVLQVMRPVNDPDTFWHLAAGDRLRETWTFSGPDPWSTMSTLPWRMHEWLPELLMSVVQQAFGLAGVSWLLPLGAAAIALTLWAVLRRHAGLLVTAVVMLVALLAMSASMSLRPQLVTFALTAVTAGAWLRTRNDGRARWWLIPLTWVWACSHGMWFVGVAVGVVALVGLFLDRTVRGRAWLRLAVVPLGSLGVAALTPVGPELLAAPWAVRGYAQFISEWRSPSLTDIGFVGFLVLAGVALLVWVRSPRRPSWTEILLLGLAVGFALLYVRTIAVGAAIAAPVTALALQGVLPAAPEPVRRREVALTLGLAAAALAVAGFVATTRGAEPGMGANDLDTPIAALPAGTVLCNDYTVGGWLIWKHPNVRPAIDGRVEVYSVQHMQSYVDFQAAVPGWQKYLTQTGCRWALVPNHLPVAEALTAQAHWNVAARGSGYLLLRAPG
ncbi:hypothetical protein GCM10027053_52280 [Intrasporangium mesophilum]